MHKLPEAQDRSWLFFIEAPGHVRGLQPVMKVDDDDTSAMPVVLVSDRKTGGVSTFDAKLQHPCSGPLQPPVDTMTPAFSSVALQRAPGTNMALSLCIVGKTTLWVGWSSGHIGIYRMHSESAVAAPFNATSLGVQRSKSHEIHWAVIDYLDEHRAAVHTLVTGPGPWIFSASQDLRLIQWHAEKREPIRDLTSVCRFQDEYRHSPIRMMCIAMGCSCTTGFTRPRGHFVFFFSTERRVLYGLSLGGPSRTRKVLSDKDVPLQRITSTRPAVTSSAVLVGDGEDDAAAVLCLGDDDGTITFTPLTVVYNEHPELTSPSSSSDVLSDEEYLRVVADAALTADTLHVNRGCVTALSVLSAHVDKATENMSYCLAAVSRNVISLLRVNVSPVVLGGRVNGCALLSVIPIESPVTSLVPLFLPVRQSAVVMALSTFADGTAAALLHFISRITGSRGDICTTRQMPQGEKFTEALQERLCAVLGVVSRASVVAEETERIMEEQRQELQRLRTAKDILSNHVMQLTEALNQKSAEVVTLKQQNICSQEEKTVRVNMSDKVLQNFNGHHHTLIDQQNLFKTHVKKAEEGKGSFKESDMENDHIHIVPRETEARYQSSMTEFRRENCLLTETLGHIKHDECETCAHSHTYSSERENTGGNELSLRVLLEQALCALNTNVNKDTASRGSNKQTL